MITVFLADDHPAIRNSIRYLIEKSDDNRRTLEVSAKVYILKDSMGNKF